MYTTKPFDPQKFLTYKPSSEYEIKIISELGPLISQKERSYVGLPVINTDVLPFISTIFEYTALINYTSFIEYSVHFLILIITLVVTLLKTSLLSKSLIQSSLIFALKFILLIALLVFIRGGIPRYRYDFLTKIGWLKLLSLTLVYFLSLTLTVFLVI